MIRFALSLTILALFASPLFAQSLPERLAMVEANNAALTATVQRIEADVATIKMNTNAMAAKVDALDAKVERLIRQQASAPGAVDQWGNVSSASSAGNATVMYASSNAGMSRPGLLGRIFGRRGSGGGVMAVRASGGG